MFWVLSLRCSDAKSRDVYVCVRRALYVLRITSDTGTVNT